MAITQAQNTQIARQLGLIGANETAGSGLVAERLKTASSSIKKQYEQLGQ